MRSSTSRGRAARAGADDAVRRDRRREATPPVWAGPPADFTLERARIRALRFVAAWHPELVALAQTGDLLLYERPFAYRERRSDGYCEPEAILVLGTAHVGTQSAADTTALIQAVRPDKVVVELCRSRAVALYRDVGERAERSHRPHKAAAANQGVPLAMGGSSLLEAFRGAVARGGLAAVALQIVARLALMRTLPPDMRALVVGAEFPAAREAADAVGAEVVLGDRPIEITLRRAWDAVSWRGRAAVLRAALGLVSAERVSGGAAPLPGLFDGGSSAATAAYAAPGVLGAASAEAGGGSAVHRPSAAVALERGGEPPCGQAGLVTRARSVRRSDDWITAATAELGRIEPRVLGPLLHERDLYLTWSLKRSKAVNNSRLVVGVVGKGHLRGIMYAMENDPHGEIRLADLVDGRNTREYKRRQGRHLASTLARDTLAFGALAWAWSAASAAWRS